MIPRKSTTMKSLAPGVPVTAIWTVTVLAVAFALTPSLPLPKAVSNVIVPGANSLKSLK